MREVPSVRWKKTEAEIRGRRGTGAPFQIGEKSLLPVPKTKSKSKQRPCLITCFLVDDGVVRFAQVREEFQLFRRVAHHPARVRLRLAVVPLAPAQLQPVLIAERNSALHFLARGEPVFRGD